ncbi:MAG: hypothetical protein RIQ47_621 [Bacteroidota bacterium]|jgi:hypothetical protein
MRSGFFSRALIALYEENEKKLNARVKITDHQALLGEALPDQL